jgi:hypothetical protein
LEVPNLKAWVIKEKRRVRTGHSGGLYNCKDCHKDHQEDVIKNQVAFINNLAVK